MPVQARKQFSIAYGMQTKHVVTASNGGKHSTQHQSYAPKPEKYLMCI